MKNYQELSRIIKNYEENKIKDEKYLSCLSSSIFSNIFLNFNTIWWFESSVSNEIISFINSGLRSFFALGAFDAFGAFVPATATANIPNPFLLFLIIL